MDFDLESVGVNLAKFRELVQIQNNIKWVRAAIAPLARMKEQ